MKNATLRHHREDLIVIGNSGPVSGEITRASGFVKMPTPLPSRFRHMLSESLTRTGQGLGIVSRLANAMCASLKNSCHSFVKWEIKEQESCK